MTTERTDGTTPNGGAYALATYVMLDTLEEVDQDKATGMVIAEYDENDRWIAETVSEYRQPTSG